MNKIIISIFCFLIVIVSATTADAVRFSGNVTYRAVSDIADRLQKPTAEEVGTTTPPSPPPVVVPEIVSVMPTSGTVGTVVTIVGTGYGSNDNVTVSFGTNGNIQQAIASAYGSFSTTFTVDTQQYGTTTITVSGVSSATNMFHILSPPPPPVVVPEIVSVMPTSGTVGTVVTIVGTGYGSNDNVTVSFGTNGNIQQAIASAYGSFSTTFTVDTQQYGTTTITVSGVSSATNMFHILSPPPPPVVVPEIVSVAPTAGTVGTLVTISGTGYAAGDRITISFGTNVNIQQVVASTNGSFTTSFMVDTQAYGTTTITASGASVVAQNVFVVQSPPPPPPPVVVPEIVSVAPTAGTVGTLVTISGTGYAAGDRITISFGTNVNIQQVVASTNGSFTTSFMVDTQAYGTTTITASGASVVAQNVFVVQSPPPPPPPVVVPEIVSVAPTAGTVGTLVTISGTGYAAGDRITISFGTNVNIQQVVASTNGSFTTSFMVDTQAYGTTTITASGASVVAQNVFVVQSPPPPPPPVVVPEIVSVAPTAGTVGTLVTISGTGYAAGDRITISFGTNVNIQQVVASTNGSFTTSFMVDTQAYGTTTITASGASVVAQNVFVVQSPPPPPPPVVVPEIVSVAPTAGTVGTLVTISGTGYAAGDRITISFGTNVNIQQVVASTNGSFTTSFMVDTQAYGTTTITASGASVVAQNVFVVQSPPPPPPPVVVPEIVSVAPTAGTVGTLVTISGTGYAAGDRITISFGTNVNIQQVVASTNGSFTTSFMVDTQAYGTTTITTSGASVVAQNVFVVQSPPPPPPPVVVPEIVSVAPTAGTVGTLVTISGTGYAAGDRITISFGTNVNIQQVVASTNGSFTTSFMVDTQAYGTTTITASGASVVAQNVFVVQSPPPPPPPVVVPEIVSVAPTAGTVGTLVTISGTGYAAGDRITISFGTNVNIQQAIASAYGSFSTTFTVDTQVYGTTTITASGASVVAQNVFVVQSPPPPPPPVVVPEIVSVAPTAGTVGTLVTISGTGYAAGDRITISFGTNVNIQQVVASTNGSFTTSFMVDTQAYGTTTITASGASVVAQNVFVVQSPPPPPPPVVVPEIVSVAPTAGTVGTLVTISGTGYAAGDRITISFGTNVNIQQVVASTNGSFTTSFMVDTQAYGTTTITASGISNATGFFVIEEPVYVGTISVAVNDSNGNFRLDCDGSQVYWGSDFVGLVVEGRLTFGITSLTRKNVSVVYNGSIFFSKVIPVQGGEKQVTVVIP